MVKIVLWVNIEDEKTKSKAMKAVSKLPGVESVSVDMNDKKLTVAGDVDPVRVVDKLKKVCSHEIISVGPEKEPEKKKKKEEPKEINKSKKEDEKNKELEEKLAEHIRLCEYYHYQMRYPYY